MDHLQGHVSSEADATAGRPVADNSTCFSARALHPAATHLAAPLRQRLVVSMARPVLAGSSAEQSHSLLGTGSRSRNGSSDSESACGADDTFWRPASHACSSLLLDTGLGNTLTEAGLAMAGLAQAAQALMGSTSRAGSVPPSPPSSCQEHGQAADDVGAPPSSSSSSALAMAMAASGSCGARMLQLRHEAHPLHARAPCTSASEGQAAAYAPSLATSSPAPRPQATDGRTPIQAHLLAVADAAPAVMASTGTGAGRSSAGRGGLPAGHVHAAAAPAAASGRVLPAALSYKARTRPQLLSIKVRQRGFSLVARGMHAPLDCS